MSLLSLYLVGPQTLVTYSNGIVWLQEWIEAPHTTSNSSKDNKLQGSNRITIFPSHTTSKENKLRGSHRMRTSPTHTTSKDKKLRGSHGMTTSPKVPTVSTTLHLMLMPCLLHVLKRNIIEWHVGNFIILKNKPLMRKMLGKLAVHCYKVLTQQR